MDTEVVIYSLQWWIGNDLSVKSQPRHGFIKYLFYSAWVQAAPHFLRYGLRVELFRYVLIYKLLTGLYRPKLFIQLKFL